MIADTRLTEFLMGAVVLAGYLLMFAPLINRKPEQMTWRLWLVFVAGFAVFAFGMITILGWHPEYGNCTSTPTHHCFPWGD